MIQITQLGAFITSQFTTASGAFTFANLPPGNYILVERDAANFVSVNSFPGTGGFRINANQLLVSLAQGATSSGHVFLDRTSVVSPTVGTISGSVLQDS